MPEFTKYKPNTFCWPELATSDPDGAKKFYGELLGWQTQDAPIDENTVYTMGLYKGRNVAGMYKMHKQQADMGVPPHWLSYISVEDADATAKKAKELGANAVVEPMDVFTIGRMAVITDPTGAMFALWQPKEHIGSQLANEPGSFCWNELHTNDVDKAGSFYTNLFGWSADPQETPNGVYTTFMNGEDMGAGMMEIAPEWGNVPPNWMVYFAVTNCDQSYEKVIKLGGKSITPPMDIPQVGRFAVVQDPQGAVFSVIALENPPEPAK